jgi:hypothetical protein
MQIITVATVALIIFTIFLLIRNNNVYEFRIGLINDFYKVDKGFFWDEKNVPSYQSMLFNIKPLQKKYWLSKELIKEIYGE